MKGATMAFTLHTVNGVRYLTSDLLRARHAFATRCGGFSSLPHTASLNLAFGRGDDDGTVRDNLAAFADAVGFDPHAVVSVPQVHGKTVHRVDVCHRGLGYGRPAGEMSGDGYVTSAPGVVLGVKTADCTPILLEARRGGTVVAVAALHAGWRGTVADIAGEGVRSLRELAAETDVSDAPIDLFAAIGPCIHPCCFDVQDDCLTAIRAAVGDTPDPTHSDRSIAETCVRHRPDGRTAPDLPAMNAALLLRAGVPADHMDICPLCTACRTDLFYSHRAMHGHRGTMLSVCML